MYDIITVTQTNRRCNVNVNFSRFVYETNKKSLFLSQIFLHYNFVSNLILLKSKDNIKLILRYLGKQINLTDFVT